MVRALPQDRKKVLARTLNNPFQACGKQSLSQSFTIPLKLDKTSLLSWSHSQQDVYQADLFQSAKYISLDTKISSKGLPRFRTQNTEEIPTHQYLYYGDKTHKSETLNTDYGDRQCPACAEHAYLLIKSTLTPNMVRNSLIIHLSLHPSINYGTLFIQKP